MNRLLGVLILALCMFPVEPVALEAQESGGEECLRCFTCFINGMFGHQTTQDGLDSLNTFGEDGLHPTQCKFGSCDFEHPGSFECEGSSQEEVEEIEKFAAMLPEITDAIRQGDLDVLVSIAQSPLSGDRITYSPHRQAIQITGCGGSVLAHIPVNRPIADERIAYLLRMTSNWSS